MSLPLYRRRVLPGGRAAHEKFCQESYALCRSIFTNRFKLKANPNSFFLPEMNQMITYYDTEYTQKEEDNCKRKKKTNKSKNDRKDQISKKKKKGHNIKVISTC